MHSQQDNSPVESALAYIGPHEEARRKMLAALRDVEAILMDRDFDARLEVVGPILDALHQDVPLLQKKVRTAPERPILNFNYYYRSAIARGLVLSRPEISDHVWEPQTSRLLLHLAQGAGAVAVGGAYFGDHALLVGQMLQLENSSNPGQVHCFEMNRSQLELCEQNARENGIQNLIFHHRALYSRPGVYLSLSGEDAAAWAQESAPDEVGAVPAATLQQVAQEHDLSGFDLLMLDIEGGELEALRGGEQFLAQGPAKAPDIIFEVHRHYTDWSQGLQNTPIVRYLRGFGYQVFAVRDYQSNVDLRGYPIELIPPETCYLQGPPHGFNLVAVQDITRLQGPQFRFVDHVSPKLLFHRDPALHAPVHKSQSLL
ncbi:MAG: FkbM family methyltransferase [Desulfohalobiaceae bacterium]